MIPTLYSHNQSLFPAIFNDFFDDNFLAPRFNRSTPAVNVSEDDKAYNVEVAAPGMTKDDFRIQLGTDDTITISMEKKTETKDNKKYLRHEFSYSKFEQRLVLPDNVVREHIAANMTDGVLHITLPKKTEEEKAQEIKYIEIQ